MRLLRAVTFGILATVLSALTFVATMTALALDPRRGRVTHAVARLWGRAMLGVAGARLVVTGTEHLRPSEPRVLAATHASYLDIPALFVAFDGQMRFVARHTLVRVPFIGWFVYLAGHFPVHRDDPRRALDFARRASRRMRRDGLSAALFPEGTRSRDGRLQPLRPGAFQLALEIGVPVQPVVVRGASEMMPRGAWYPRRSGTIEVRFGEAIPTAGRSGSAARKALAAEVREALVRLGAPV